MEQEEIQSYQDWINNDSFLQEEATKARESSPIRIIEEPCFIMTTPTALPYLPFHNGSVI
jgi:hypothetical protein